MPKFRAGKSGRTKVNGAVMSNQSWAVQLQADELDTSNFEGNGKKSWLIGLQWLTWNVGTLWNAQQNPLADPPGLYVRDDGINMQLFENVTDNKFWNLPSWICSESKMDCTVSGLVMFSASGKAQDNFELLNTSVP
jgi:hypothetical protein